MRGPKLALVATLLFLLAGRGDASGIDTETVVFDLTKGPDPGTGPSPLSLVIRERIRDCIRWSPSRALDLHEDGLGFAAKPDHCCDGWVHFVEPIALGMPHWAPAIVSIRVRIDRDRKAPETVYVRYGPDGVHWSSWQVLSEARGVLAERFTHAGTLSVPRTEREAFEEACYRDAGRNANDIDQEATLKRLVEVDPRYLSRVIPVIGYVQFLHESSYYGGERFRRLEAELTWGVPGTIRPANSGRWRFRDACRVDALGTLHVPPGANLRELSLGSTPVTDEGLAALADLAWLRRLDLADTKITDAGLAHVADLRLLEALDLSGTRVTDEGLLRLQVLSGLDELGLRGTEVTDEAVAKLRQALDKPDPRQLRVVRQAPGEATRIERVLKAVEEAKVGFVLGNLQCSRGRAALELRKRLDAVASRVRTAEDFIEEVAARPAASGEPLQVRLPDGSYVDLASWLKGQLDR